MSGTVAATPRIRAIQRVALAMIVLAGVVNTIDRATLAVANEPIRHDLGLSISQMGYLLSAFLWAYAFAQLPAGALVDRLGPRLLPAVAMTLWSLAQVLGGLVSGFGQFVGARVLLGLCEAPQFPAGARVVRDWFNARDRGLATGIFNTSFTLASAIGAPLLTVLMLRFGWRWMFIIMGAAGLIMAVLWFTVYRNPADLTLTAEENAYRTQGDPPGRQARVTFGEWRHLFGFRTTWGMMLGFFGCVYGVWIYSAWLPAYLETERHMSIRATGFFAAIPFLCGMPGSVLGGCVSDILLRRGMTPMGSRKVPAALALLGTAVCTVAAACVASNLLAIAFISASVFLLLFAATCAWALSSVAAPTNCTASIAAIQNFGGYLGGALAPTVTGLIVQTTGSFFAALITGAVTAVASAVAYLTLVGEPVTARDLGVLPAPDLGIAAGPAHP